MQGADMLDRNWSWGENPMIDGGENAPLTEPVIVPDLFITGGSIELMNGVVRFVGWTHVPQLGGETEERRIVVRISLPLSKARELSQKLLQEANKRAG